MAKKKLDLDDLLAKIVRLFVRHHPSTLSFSKVSQLTGVPRSTLYYYFGNSRENMLEEAVKFGMQTFVSLVSFDHGTDYPDFRTLQIKRFEATLQLIRKYPWAPALYFRFRNDPGRLGERVRDIELKYNEKMAKVWAKYNNGTPPDEDALAVTGGMKLGFFWIVGAMASAEEHRSRLNEESVQWMIEAMTDSCDLVMRRKRARTTR